MQPWVRLRAECGGTARQCTTLAHVAEGRAPLGQRRPGYRLTFLGGLFVVFMIGLAWALNPDEPPDLAQSSFADDEPAETRSPEPEPSPEGTSTAGGEELLAAARPPAQTIVQVLDAGGGRDRLQDAASRMQELGYQVITTTSSRQDVTRTMVWFTTGQEDEARALRARDPRVTQVGPNQGLSEGVDLHVLIGPDWR